ncbi:MAG: SDR family oxidoreductase [Candidatus Bathyarchaeota archaeon]|nr:SDR family oxidoreductase [Candidatus Bathyarchaeota archaeon]
MIDPQLEGKVAIVTGANHGIGAATAKALAAQGTKVFIAYYLPDCPYSEQELEEARRVGVGGVPLYCAMQQQSAEDVLNAIHSCRGIATAHELDLGNVENIATLFDLCEEEIGPVDILINNHTHCVGETFDPYSVRDKYPKVYLTHAESIDRHFAVNARACALMMREYLERHIRRKARWGRIISLTTTSAHARSVSYAASKHAVVSYNLSAAQEMGKYGITVNIVFPGATQTGYIPPEHEKPLAAKTPLGRVGQPEDIADVIVFLSSEQAHWITGQIIYASGGFQG